MSLPAMLGRATTPVRPGAVGLADHGVLVLEDAPELSPVLISAIRAAVRDRVVTLAQAGRVATFPARVQMVLGARPCRCWQPTDGCGCTDADRRRYLRRMSALTDLTAIRLTAAVPALPRSGSAAELRAVVTRARETAAARWASHGHATNAAVPMSVLRQRRFRLPAALTRTVDALTRGGALSDEGAAHVLRLAFTLADLDSSPRPDASHVEEAIALLEGM
jgi:magnesium chelatase family protein